MIYSFGVGAITGLVALSAELFNNKTRDILSMAFGIPAGVCAFVLALTFLAFLISLIVSSSKGE